MHRLFLEKYLRNRPDYFLCYYAWKPVWGNPKNLLLLKTDAIGDYLLFRNYLTELASRFRPEGYRIFLAGNSAWKDLAEYLDSDSVDAFFWLNRGGMNRKPNQESILEFLRQINRHRYSILVYPNFSREWEAGDYIAQHIPAKQKFAFKGNQVNQTKEQHDEGNRIYNRLLHPENAVKFDFFRNGEMISAVTSRKTSIRYPEIRAHLERKNSPAYAVFFPGASFETRRWPSDRFATLGKTVFERYGLRILLAGGLGEFELCSQIEKIHPDVFQNLAGTTTLPELLELIAGAALLVSNDTSAIHIGAQARIPSVCIYKGNNYGRCMPYPEGLLPNLKLCMPPDLCVLSESERALSFTETDGANILDISSDQLFIVISEFFQQAAQQGKNDC